MAEYYGSDLIVDLLNQYDFEYICLNPGATFRGIHDSIVNYAGNRPEIIECPHENIAIGMAHGYAKATGKTLPAVVHNVVGLLHGALAIYYAYLDHAPVMVLGATGPMEAGRRRPRLDWDHTALVQGNAVRDFVKWDAQPFGAEAVVESFARAYRITQTEPKGPVYLCYDVLFQEDELHNGQELLLDSRYPKTHSSISADSDAIQRVTELLTHAKRPVIITDFIGRNPENVHVLVELAELLAAPVVDGNVRMNFPNRHPLLSDKTSIRDADVVLAMDVRDLYGCLVESDWKHHTNSYLINDACKVIEIGMGELNINGWSQGFQRFQQTDVSILADTKTALPRLLRACKQRVTQGGLPTDASAANRESRMQVWRARFAEREQRWLEEARVDWDASFPMTTARLASEIWTVIKDKDWVLTANTLNGWTRKLWDFDNPSRHVGRSLGTATQIGISLGVALAYKGTGKLVVDIQPDGDLMFNLGALWVATHHKIPMLIVMYNNRAYYNDWKHQIDIAENRGRDVQNAYVGQEVDNPAPDYANIARSFGWYAEGPIQDGALVAEAVRRAIDVIEKEGRPALVDCITRFR